MIISYNELPEAVSGLYTRLESIERLILQKSDSPSKDELLTVAEAAKFLSVAIPTIYGYVHRNEIPYMKKGKRLYFSREALMNWMLSSRVETSQELQASTRLGLIESQNKRLNK